MSNPVRGAIPIRSEVAAKTNYRNYKSDLRSDFNRRCGYCDDGDEFFGGERGFHIDHFAPKSLFADLTSEYSNLIYSCPFCNGAKSNKWVTEQSEVSHNGKTGFIDPCLDEFDEHLDRAPDGRIVAKSDLGRYIIQNLKLNLARHQIIWQAQKLDELSDRYSRVRERAKGLSGRYVELLDTLADINEAYKEYRRRVFD